MSIKSEIRPSQIAALTDKVRKGNYSMYLKSALLKRARGFGEAQVSFDFPVTALIGPNGGGKSTVLGAAACAYKEIKPGLFFPKSSIGDNSMSEWSIEYDIIDRSKNSSGTTRRSSSFRQMKWVRGEVLSRPLMYFGISRTVPAGERPAFKKLMRPSYSHTAPLEALPETAAREIQHILGKSVVDFKRTNITVDDIFHTGKNKGNEYSEFHFGAGESSIIRIVTAIELLPENALILIEEIENGLHPVATRRLVEYLVMAAERKKIQAVFTTHSDDALEVLPNEAIWACLDGDVQQGRLSIHALRVITGKVDTKLAIFTEDAFGTFIVQALLREFLPSAIPQIEVFGVEGDGNAVKVHTNRAADPTAQYKSLCVLDGDSRQQDAPNKGIYRLPGAQPEYEVFSAVLNDLPKVNAILTVSLQLPPEKQQQVEVTLHEVSSTNRDPHLLFNQVGIKLGFLSEEIVRGAFVNLWIRSRPQAFNDLIAAVQKAME